MNRCIGLKISDVWVGYGTAIFIELGNLHSIKDVHNKKLRKAGDITIMIEWSWRLEGPISIITGSFDSKKIMESRSKILIGKTINDISLVCRIPELYITTSGNKWIHTFATEKGQPKWCLFFRNEEKKEWLCVDRGKVNYENGD